MGLRGFEPRSAPLRTTPAASSVAERPLFGSRDDRWAWPKLAEGDELQEDRLFGGGFSHESEHDLALLVSDFLENGSGGADGPRWCSSDSDSGIPDLNHLADKITFYKHVVDQYEIDLLAVVHSLLLSIKYPEPVAKDGPCNCSCVRRTLAKRLRMSGYNASVCLSKWQGSNKVPGGDHEYIDVVVNESVGGVDRFIIDIDFRSHFEIARAVESYDAILKTLPVVYVGSWPRLKQLLQIMADAAQLSLKQNSMPLPPWRSLPYLKAKWQSPFERVAAVHDQSSCHDHKSCAGQLRRLKSSIQSEIETQRLLVPIVNGKKWRVKPEKKKTSLLKF